MEGKGVAFAVGDVPHPTDKGFLRLFSAVQNLQGFFRVAEDQLLRGACRQIAQKDFGDDFRHGVFFQVLPQMGKPVDKASFANEMQVAFSGIVKDDFAFGKGIQGAFKRAIFAFGTFDKEGLHAKIGTESFDNQRRIAVRHPVQNNDFCPF